MRKRKSLAGAALAAAIGFGLAIDLPAAATGGPWNRPLELADGKIANLAGTWTGQYRYSDKRLPPKAFSVSIVANGKAFTGRVTEPRMTRTGASGLLNATIAGALEKSGTVRFTKRYQGVAGFGNPVLYEGKLGPRGKTVKGTWRIPQEKLQGTFEMKRGDSI